MLTREERLRKPGEFRAVYSGGRAFAGRLLRLYVLRGEGGLKAGVVASKRVGGSVERNRARRLVGEAVRALRPHLAEGVRLVFVGKAGIAAASFADVSVEVRGLLERAEVLDTHCGGEGG